MDTSNCTRINCQYTNKYTNRLNTNPSPPVENIQCLNGRCFRGQCRPEGKLLRHVVSGNCLQSETGLGAGDSPRMVACPKSK